MAPPPPPPPGALPGPPRVRNNSTKLAAVKAFFKLQGCCYSECVLKALKIWDNGKFNKDVAKSALGEALKSKPELKPVRKCFKIKRNLSFINYCRFLNQPLISALQKAKLKKPCSMKAPNFLQFHQLIKLAI